MDELPLSLLSKEETRKDKGESSKRGRGSKSTSSGRAVQAGMDKSMWRRK